MTSDTPPPTVRAAELRALLDRITPLPWAATDQGQGAYGIGWAVEDADGDIVASRVICYDGEPLGAMTAENAHFIVAAANALPALLERVETLERAVRLVEWVQVFEGPKSCVCCWWEQEDGHRPDCGLAALLGAEGEGEDE